MPIVRCTTTVPPNLARGRRRVFVFSRRNVLFVDVRQAGKASTAPCRFPRGDSSTIHGKSAIRPSSNWLGFVRNAGQHVYPLHDTVKQDLVNPNSLRCPWRARLTPGSSVCCCIRKEKLDYGFSLHELARRREEVLFSFEVLPRLGRGAIDFPRV